VIGYITYLLDKEGEIGDFAGGEENRFRIAKGGKLWLFAACSSDCSEDTDLDVFNACQHIAPDVQ
jgi:hypothetical protein